MQNFSIFKDFNPEWSSYGKNLMGRFFILLAIKI